MLPHKPVMHRTFQRRETRYPHEKQITEFGFADANCVRQGGLKYRFQLAW